METSAFAQGAGYLARLAAGRYQLQIHLITRKTEKLDGSLLGVIVDNSAFEAISKAPYIGSGSFLNITHDHTGMM